ETREHFDGSGLACSVGPQKTIELLFLYSEIKVFHSHQWAKCPAQGVGLQYGFSHVGLRYLSTGFNREVYSTLRGALPTIFRCSRIAGDMTRAIYVQHYAVCHCLNDLEVCQLAVRQDDDAHGWWKVLRLSHQHAGQKN